MGKKPKRKTEPCEFCNGKHFSEQARLRCMKSKRPECECPRYWTATWLSHSPDCPLRGELRDELQPYTDEELAAKAARSKPKTVRRKVNA